MPAYLETLYWIKILWPMILFVVLVVFILLGSHKLFQITAKVQTPMAPVLLAGIAFTLLGLVTGFMTGLSREPVVGAVLPAVLSLVGGVGIFLIGRNDNNVVNLIVPGAVTALAISILVGALWGANERENWNQIKEAKTQIRHDPEHLTRQAEVEAYVRLQRRQLGLPEEPPVTPWPKLRRPPPSAADLEAADLE